MALSFILPPALGRAKAEARAELVEGALSRELGEPVSAYVADSYRELEERVAAGQHELAWAPAAVCVRLPPVRAVLTVVRHGMASYLSALITRRTAALTVSTLKGARAAWVDRLSVGGYLLAAARLRAEGVDPDRALASQAFLGSHRAAVEAVLHEHADLTAVSMPTTEPGQLASMLRWYAGPAGDRLVPIAFTERCLNDAVVLTSTLPEAEARRIADKLAPPRGGPPSRLLAVLEAEGLVRSEHDDYRKLAPLLGLTPGRAPSRSPPRMG